MYDHFELIYHVQSLFSSLLLTRVTLGIPVTSFSVVREQINISLIYQILEKIQKRYSISLKLKNKYQGKRLIDQR